MEPRNACETEHEFVLVLGGIPELTPAIMDRIFEAGCDDATVSMRSAQVHLEFSRTASSFKEAILSAIRDVRKSGIGGTLLRVDNCNLVTQADIGRRIDRSRSLVNQYATGKRGPGNFPSPTCDISEGNPLYRWCEVSYWLCSNGIIGDHVVKAAQDLELINSLLEWYCQKQVRPEEVEEIVEAVMGTRA